MLLYLENPHQFITIYHFALLTLEWLEKFLNFVGRGVGFDTACQMWSLLIKAEIFLHSFNL